MRSSSLPFLLIFSVAIFSCGEKKSLHEEVRVDGGLISGVAKDSLSIFRGIPFAAPPLKNLRWKAPQPVLAWEGVKNCDKFGPSPMQAKPTPFMVYTSEFLIPEEPINEDCLHLNIWTAAKSAEEKRPVLVWIYGGGFVSGGTAVPIYDGEALARKGVVFVSVNYRVGIFGFFAHPGLSNETDPRHSGNYGLLDQIAALKWVQKNISAFGGDPGNVTIAGQSAGSMSVNCLVASPLAKGLFHKAIAESGSGMLPKGLVSSDLRTAEERGRSVALSLYASTTEDMRAIPADTLVKKVKERFTPIIDGYVLPEPIHEIFSKGKENDVPLLTGWNADEGFVWTPQSRDEYLREAKEKYGADAATYLKYYPADTDAQLSESRLAISRDLTFALPNYRWAVVQSDKNRDAFVYFFERRPPAEENYRQYRSFHTAEVAYALDNLKFVNRPWEKTDHALARVMSSYWANFCKTGDPNGGDLPAWPKFTSKERNVIVLGDSVYRAPMKNLEALDFLYSKAAN
jgi:para-nitrobenzyl esterase